MAPWRATREGERDNEVAGTNRPINNWALCSCAVRLSVTAGSEPMRIGVSSLDRKTFYNRLLDKVRDIILIDA